jgi:hypothetical protein
LATRQYIPEDSELHTRRRENLKSYTQRLYIFDPNTESVVTLKRVSEYIFKNKVLSSSQSLLLPINLSEEYKKKAGLFK